jgi:PAS domain S-box-containing protein
MLLVMSVTDNAKMKKLLEIAGFNQNGDPALAITLKFVGAGILWILFSDSLLFFLGTDNIVWKLAHVHILKGLFFVAVTGGFLFFWTNRFVLSLQQREAEVKHLFQSSPIPMGILDAQSGKFLEVNESLAVLFGISQINLRGLNMSGLAEEPERFEAVPLLIKTGSRQLGRWKFKKSDQVISVELCAQPVRERQAYLMIFTDVTNQVRNEKDLMLMKASLEKQYNDRINQLTRMNEELAYRASQTEHVNNELISVNEQLQHVNKKMALRAEDALWKNDQLHEVMSSLSDAFWSFDLTGRSKSFISASAQALYDEPYENLLKPWFWLEFIHPEDIHVKEQSQQHLMEYGFAVCTYRIVTRKGIIKTIFNRIKLVHDPKGIPMIVGCATDLSDLNKEYTKVFSTIPAVKKINH